MTDAVFAQSLETARMWLRCPLPGDGVAVYEGVMETLTQLREWPDSLPWAQNEQSPRVSEDYCQTCYAAWVMRVTWPMLMLDKSSAQFAGTVGFHHIDWTNRVWELGYWCRSSFQGQGRMTEAVQALSMAAHKAWPDMQLTSRVDARHLASIKVLERSGYQLLKEEAQAASSGEDRLVLHYAWGRALQTGQSA